MQQYDNDNADVGGQLIGRLRKLFAMGDRLAVGQCAVADRRDQDAVILGTRLDDEMAGDSYRNKPVKAVGQAVMDLAVDLAEEALLGLGVLPGVARRVAAHWRSSNAAPRLV